MKLFRKRFVNGFTLDKIVKEYNSNSYSDKYTRYDFYDTFFTSNEKKFIKSVYMTIYSNDKGRKYIIFTNHIPQPSGFFTTNYKELIGKSTGYGTKIISCEKCYVIG